MCDTKINHLKIEYKEFINLIETKNLNDINSDDIYIQKMFVAYMINKKNIIDYTTINKYYVDLFAHNLKLTKSQISKIKNKYLDEYKGLDFIQLLEKIKDKIPNLFTQIYDIKYNIKIKNKNTIRENRIIFFGIKDNLEFIPTTEEYFADTTFKVIPSKLRPYKLFIIIGIGKNDRTTRIFFLILTKYTDVISYRKIFNYLYEHHDFKPRIIHTDFEKAISLALNDNIEMKNNLIHTRCFFHFSNMLKKQLTKSGIFKRKMNRLSIEIISNLEILCFIKLNKIKDFQKIIIKKLETNKKLENFVKYLQNYIFKIEPKIYNYSEIIEHFKSDDNNIFLDKLYTTNNICESLNGKLSFYLPKKSANNYNFVSAISNILSNSLMDQPKTIYRKDYKTKSLIELIDDLDFNNNLSWISYEVIKKYLKKIINEKQDNQSEEQIQKIINFILEEDDERLEFNNDNLDKEGKEINNLDEDEKQNVEELINNDVVEEKDEEKSIINIEDEESVKEECINNIEDEESVKEESLNNIEGEESESEDANIINENKDDSDKLINLIEELNINENGKVKNWFNIPLSKRVKIRAKKGKNNLKNKKGKNRMPIIYPKDSD